MIAATAANTRNLDNSRNLWRFLTYGVSKENQILAIKAGFLFYCDE